MCTNILQVSIFPVRGFYFDKKKPLYRILCVYRMDDSHSYDLALRWIMTEDGRNVKEHCVAGTSQEMFSLSLSIYKHTHTHTHTQDASLDDISYYAYIITVKCRLV